MQSLENSKVVLEKPLGRLLLQHDKCHLLHIRFQPEEYIALHKNNVDVIFYINKGKGVAEIDGHKHSISEGDSVAIATDSERGLTNTGDSEMEVLVIKLMQ